MKKLSIILIIFLLVALGIGCYVLLQEEHLNVVYGAKKSNNRIIRRKDRYACKRAKEGNIMLVKRKKGKHKIT